MPVVGGGDGDGVNALVIEELPDIGVGDDRFLVLGEIPDLFVQDLAVHIAQGRYSHARDLAELTQQPAPPDADANHGHADVVVGSQHPRRRQQQHAPRGGHALQESTAARSLHEGPPFTGGHGIGLGNDLENRGATAGPTIAPAGPGINRVAGSARLPLGREKNLFPVRDER
jgi:hypothetical protein